MKRVALIALAVMLTACAPDISKQSSPEEILTALDHPWVRDIDTIDLLLTNPEVTDHINGGICNASPAWLTVASRLYPLTDAHLAEEMSSALSVALTKEPKIVLERFESVCHAPEHLPASCNLPDWRSAALEALRTVNDPALAAKRQECESDVQEQQA